MEQVNLNGTIHVHSFCFDFFLVRPCVSLSAMDGRQLRLRDLDIATRVEAVVHINVK